MIMLTAISLHIFLLGSMISFLIITTPAVFKTLDEKNAQKFLRYIFPVLFKYCLIIVIIAGLLFILGNSFYGSIVSIIIGFGFIINVFVLTPKINKYRDYSLSGVKDAKKKFKQLHLFSVVIFLVQLFLSFSILIFYSQNHLIFFLKGLI